MKASHVVLNDARSALAAYDRAATEFFENVQGIKMESPEEGRTLQAAINRSASLFALYSDGEKAYDRAMNRTI